MGEIAEILYIDIEENIEYEKIIEEVLKKCFEVENIKEKTFYVSVNLCDNNKIKEINRKYRNIDNITDVLSFPMFKKNELEILKNSDMEYQELLGDIFISIPKVEEQAKEYGHSFKRELAYMTVHSFYHLIGYDHIDAKDKIEMRKKEENILNILNIGREI